MLDALDKSSLTGNSPPGSSVDHGLPQRGLTLVLGPPNAGKIKFVIDWWLAAGDENPAMIVVPTHPDVISLEHELLRRIRVAWGPAPVATFDQLIKMMRSRAGAADRSVLGPGEQALILQRLLDGMSFRRLHTLRAFPGAVGALRAFLTEVLESEEDPETVEEAFRNWSNGAGASSLLAQDLGRLLVAYRRACSERGRIDPKEAVHAARHVAGSWKRPLAFYGFTSFTPAQRRLIFEMRRHVPVLVSLVCETDHSGLRPLMPEIEALQGAADRVVMLPRQDRVFSSPSLVFLNRHFMRRDVPLAPDAVAAAEPGGVRFLLSSGRRNEIELVGGEILALLREGVAPEDIGVVFRRLGPWRRLVAQVFDAYGIPHDMESEVAFGRTGLGHALLAAVEGLAMGDAQALLVYLRSGYSGVPVEVADALEADIRTNRTMSRAGLFRMVRASCPQAVDEIGRAFHFAEDDTRLDLAGLEHLARRMLAAAGGGRLFGFHREQDQLAFAALRRTLRELMAAGENQLPLELLRLLGEFPVVTGGRSGRGTVKVVGIHRARMTRFSVLFVLGLVEGEFPEAGRSPVLLDSSSRREANLRSGKRIFAEPNPGEDVALFSLIISRPWQLLYLSARDCEDDGETAIPSPLWQAARTLLGVPMEACKRKELGDVVFPVSEAPSVREYLRSCAAEGLTKHVEVEFAPVFSSLPDWRRKVRPLELPTVIREVSGRSTFSASEIETYVQCPFRWFIERVIKPQALDENSYALRRGDLAHQVLAAVFKKLAAEGLLPLTDAGLERALELAEAYLEQRLRGLTASIAQSERRVMSWEVAEAVRGLIRFDSSCASEFSPAEFEYSLPRTGVDIGGIRIKGRIDRIDADPNGRHAVVIDYKSGQAAFGPAFSEDSALQLPLYMLALQRLWSETEVVGGIYAALANNSRKGMILAGAPDLDAWVSTSSVVDEERFRTELEDCLRSAVEAAEAIRSGRVAPKPPRRCPPFCDLGPLCRHSERRLRFGE